MKKILLIGLIFISSLVFASCSYVMSTKQPNEVKEVVNTKAQNDLKKFKSSEGWVISYPASWDRAEKNFIQEVSTGKTLEFRSENTTKEDLEKWIDKETKRKLSATEAANTMKEPLSVKQKGDLYYYSYTISTQMDGPVKLLKTTVIFDGIKRYEFYTTLPPTTEKEYDEIINSFKTKE